MTSMHEDAEFLLQNNYLLTFFEEPTTKKRKPMNTIYKKRTELGEFHHLYRELRSQEDVFFEYTRMSTSTFDYICREIEEYCSHQVTNFKKPISTEERLLLTIRFLSTGIAFRQLAFSFRISKTAVSSIVVEVCIAIWKTLNEKHMKFPTAVEFKSIAEDFRGKGKFPHCCGCIDGKHIRLKKPAHSGSMYFNYKHFYSVVLMAVCDSEYRFRIIDVGAYGKDSDGGVLSSSKFFQEINNGNCHLPGQEELPNSNIVAPYVFLGDEAFPLTNFLLRPYPRRQLQGNTSRTLFNEKLSSTRVAVECTFGIAASKFRILLKAIETSVDNAIIIVQAVCLLHNVIIDKDGPVTSAANDIQRVNIRNIEPSRTNNRPSRSALNARELFTSYFVDHSAAVVNLHTV